MRSILLTAAILTPFCLAAPVRAGTCDTANPNNPENDCDNDGCTVQQDDCDDKNDKKKSTTCGAQETCDGIDNDCDGTVDNDIATVGMDCATGQQGVCSAGTRKCQSGTPICDPTLSATTEVCDGKDNDCDGDTDENLTRICFVGASTTYTGICPGADCSPRGTCRGVSHSCSAGNWPDCNTAPSNQIGPSTETCDGQDNDCDGTVDENNPGSGGTCTNSSAEGICRAGTEQCQSGSLNCVSNIDPGTRTESCNNLDDDCDGSTDEDVTRACYTGTPSTRNVGTCHAGTQSCSAGIWATSCSGEVLPESETCNNLDDDCDGTPDDGLVEDSDNDRHRKCGTCAANESPNCDCNDNNNQIYPGRTEICNNRDDDCDGSTDENLTRTCYIGASNTYTGSCPGPDCRPRGACQGVSQSCTSGSWPACVTPPTNQIGPSAETCDGQDNDCDGAVDENNPGGGGTCQNSSAQGICRAGTMQCQSGAPICVSNIAPGAQTESCNSLDDDCDGSTDENLTRICFVGASTTYTGTCPGPDCSPRGACRGVSQNCSTGNWPNCNAGLTGHVGPMTETCDGQDNDCDGAVDDGFDQDGDGKFDCNSCRTHYQNECDCDDNNENIHPGRPERCNAIDDDCDNKVDEGGGPSGKYHALCYTAARSTMNVGVCRLGVYECTATVPGMSAYGPCMGEVTPTTETCNGLDDDCDRFVDEGYDQDKDGFKSCTDCSALSHCDCNDADPTVKPGAVERCDEVDQNCDGSLNDVAPRRCFTGMYATVETYTGICPGPQCEPRGACKAGTQTCTTAGRWSSCENQVLPAADPTADEPTCNQRDEDCDGTVDDGPFDADMDGVKSCEGDCNDNDAAINPNAPEVCDGKDNDCDGNIDGTQTACYTGPADTRGIGVCKDGTNRCVDGQGTGECIDERTPMRLANGNVPVFVDGGTNDPEVADACNGLDDDCDGTVDDGFDKDDDGVTTCATPNIDCDDDDPFNTPGALEICDCQDNNCDGTADENDVCRGAPCPDADKDGVTTCAGDCDDTDGAIGPRKTERTGNQKDDDCDGAIDEDVDEDGDGVTTGGGDCNDHLAAIHPNAIELCDGFDNNCNNQTDEGFDEDDDKATVCAGDCDDKDANRSPFKAEICGNKIDDDCDGFVDEDNDADGDGVTTCQNDCNDFDARVYPATSTNGSAAEEVCDGQDNDCDGTIDEGFDVDGDGVVSCLGDCDDTDAEVHPGHIEVPGNSKDDNCNGSTDEGAVDDDGDGFTPICGDCNDADSSIHPHAREVCDRIDNNCDSYVDSAPGKFDLCAVCFDADQDGHTNCAGDCNDADPTIYRGAPELCDQKDNDCDGDTDLDPATGLRVCSDEDGDTTMPGADNTNGKPNDGTGMTESSDAGGTSQMPQRVIMTSCGCASSSALTPWLAVALGFLLLRSRRKRCAPAPAFQRLRFHTAGALLLTACILVSCSSELTIPFQTPDTNNGNNGGNNGAGMNGDAGKPNGADFVPPVPNWPCPGINPKEMQLAEIPMTVNFFAHHTRYETTENETAQYVILDDAQTNMAAFILRRPVPMGVDSSNAQALETLAASEIASFDNLPGSPLVRDRNERFTRIYIDALGSKNYSHGEQIGFSLPTTAFALRNRLLAHLAGKGVVQLNSLPNVNTAMTEDTHVIYSFFRLTQRNLFIAVAVTPLELFKQNQPELSDLTNGSHLSGRNALLTYICETSTVPTLKTDFLFVIDNSCSMSEEQSALRLATDRLFEAFGQTSLDFRVGVITTDSDVLQGKGFTKKKDEFKSDVLVGISGNSQEMGVEYALRAIRRARMENLPEAYKLRNDAGLIVIIVSDEENTGLRSIANYAEDFLKEKAVVFAIVGPRPNGCTRVGQGRAEAGNEYIELAVRTRGSTGSICNENITEVVEEITFGAIGASSMSSLKNRPISGSLAVQTSALVPRTRMNGFDYEPSTNTILFFGNPPNVGSDFKTAYAAFNYIE